jgi:hypothetical protein
VTSIGRGIGVAFDFLSSALWALAAFFVGARLLGLSAGILLALAVFATAGVYAVTSRAQEKRAEHLARGECPRCHERTVMEHVHRRWDTATASWLLPSTTWRCTACTFDDSRAIACEACPQL